MVEHLGAVFRDEMGCGRVAHAQWMHGADRHQRTKGNHEIPKSESALHPGANCRTLFDVRGHGDGANLHDSA